MTGPRTLAALGGLTLLGALWLPWYTRQGTDSINAWQTFNGLDYTLAALAVTAIAGSAISLRLKSWNLWSLISLSGALATIAVAARILYPPDLPGADLDPTLGPLTALAGSVAMLVSLGGASRDWADL